MTFVAVVFGRDAAERDISVGAALGGPLALSTLAYGVVGLTLMGYRTLHVQKKGVVEADYSLLSRDQAWFLSIFVCKVALGLVAFPGKPWLGFAFLAAYALYIRKELASGGSVGDSEDLEPLKIRPNSENPSLF